MTAGSAPDPADARRATNDMVHRGIRWQRAASGALRWRDADAERWVRYRPGDDAPPRPPGWDGPGLVGVMRSARPTMARPPWRSPYRIVPLVLLVAILVFAVVEATRGSGGQAGAEAKAADALVGRCLVEQSSAAGGPRYGAKGVACTAAGAAVKVTEVLPGTPGAPTCPTGTTSVQLAFPGVRYPHQLCVVPNGGH